MAEIQKPAETAKPEEKAAPAAQITDASVVLKAQKGEKLSAEETEVFKALPKDQLPAAPLSDTPTPAPAASGAPKPDEKAPDTSAGEQTPKEVTEDRRKQILAEVDKPEDQVDLSKFKSDVEIGLYWDLRKARRKNQKLTDELEVERVQKIVDNLKAKETQTASEKTDAEILTEALKDRDPDDLLTVAELNKILSDAKAKIKPKEEKPAAAPILSIDQIRIQKVEAAQKLERAGIKDFDEVTSYAEAALKDDPEALEILRETGRQGGNTAEKTYWLVKGSKLWPAINKKMAEDRTAAGKTDGPKPAAENVERAERLEKNEEKIRTTGPGSGAPAAAGEYSVGEIAGMTHGDVRKLSKKQRQAILEKFGSTPNYST